MDHIQEYVDHLVLEHGDKVLKIRTKALPALNNQIGHIPSMLTKDFDVAISLLLVSYQLSKYLLDKNQQRGLDPNHFMPWHE